MIELGITFIVIAFVSLFWVQGIDNMSKNYPDYKGEDLFGEPSKEITPEMIWNDKKKEGVKRIITAHKAIEADGEKYAISTFKWPKNKNGEDQAIPAGHKVPDGYRKHMKLTKKPFIDGALSETAKNYWYESFRNNEEQN